MNIVQFVLAGISILFLSSAIFSFVKGETRYTFLKFFFIFFVWSGILFLSIFPHLASIFSMRTGLGENLNTLIFFGFVLVFMIIFKILKIFEKIEKDITIIVRNNALHDVIQKRKK